MTVSAVHQALVEFDELGREAFLRTYGFGSAKDYMLLVDGKEYDSKAIVAVAHKYLPEVGRPLKHDELSGGVSDAVRRLRDLNFEVVQRSARIDWTWDEHVLALDLYMLNPTSPPSKTSAEVVALSDLLNRLGERLGIDRGRDLPQRQRRLHENDELPALGPRISSRLQGRLGAGQSA